MENLCNIYGNAFIKFVRDNYPIKDIRAISRYGCGKNDLFQCTTTSEIIFTKYKKGIFDVLETNDTPSDDNHFIVCAAFECAAALIMRYEDQYN